MATLSDRVRASLHSDDNVAIDRAVLSPWLQGEVAKYTLGPDDFADVKRLPPNLASLQELSAWLAATSASIVSNGAQAKKNGLLRSWKNVVIAIHAINVTLPRMNEAKTLMAHSGDVVAACANNAPAQLSTKAQRLWYGTFGNKVNRIRTVIVMILRMAARPLGEAATGIPAGQVQAQVEFRSEQAMVDAVGQASAQLRAIPPQVQVETLQPSFRATQAGGQSV